MDTFFSWDCEDLLSEQLPLLSMAGIKVDTASLVLLISLFFSTLMNLGGENSTLT